MAKRFTTYSAVGQALEMYERTALGAIHRQMAMLDSTAGLRALRSNAERISEMNRVARPAVEVWQRLAPGLKAAQAFSEVANRVKALKVDHGLAFAHVEKIAGMRAGLVPNMDRILGSNYPAFKALDALGTQFGDSPLKSLERNLWAVQAIARTLRDIDDEDLSPALDELAHVYEDEKLTPEQRKASTWELLAPHLKRLKGHPVVVAILALWAMLGALDQAMSLAERVQGLLSGPDQKIGENFDERMREEARRSLATSLAAAASTGAQSAAEAQIVLRTCVELAAPDHMVLLSMNATLRLTRRGAILGQLPAGSDVVLLCLANRDAYVQADLGEGRLMTGWVRKKALERPRVPLYQGGAYLVFGDDGEDESTGP